MTRTSFSHADMASQLIAFIEGDPTARQSFPELYHTSIRKRALLLLRRCGNDLNLDLVDDVVQCFWLSLLKSAPTAFRGEAGSADSFMDCYLLTAIRDVRAMYTPPGQRTRLTKKDTKEPKKHIRNAISIDAPLIGAANGATLADVYKDPVDRIAAATSRISVEQTLTFVQSTAPPAVANAIRLVYEESASLNQAATSVGVHHTALQRKIKVWFTQHRSTLVA